MFLVIGVDSEIGGATYRAMKAQKMSVVATTRRLKSAGPDRLFLDLAKPLDSWEPPDGTHAACVCAAVARLQDCAANPEEASHINVAQTLTLIDKLLAYGCSVVFLSTNQVFDGLTPRVAIEARHSPVSEYGSQKARSEKALQALIARGAPLAILRLGRVISADTLVIKSWIADLSVGKTINAFGDMRLAPIPIDLVCSAITCLLKDKASGIFQLTGPRDVSYVEVARYLAEYFGADPALVQETSAIAAGLPEGATPLNTTLDSSLMRLRYGLQVPDCREVVRRIALSAITLR
jgi:dTDP-4-dehydrorhamnose reductase